jgi:hypothetical protein
MTIPMIYQLTMDGGIDSVEPSKDSDKRYSPLWLMDAIRSAQQVDQFDLDCCSDEVGNRNVRAKKFYTYEQNGLVKPFYGRMYCNWPFSNTLPWMQRIVDHWGNGDIEAITVVARCDFSTRWAKLAAGFFDVVCHPRDRLSFEGCDSSPDFTCVVFHRGPDPDTWAKVMNAEVGPCFRRIIS